MYRERKLLQGVTLLTRWLCALATDVGTDTSIFVFRSSTVSSVSARTSQTTLCLHYKDEPQPQTVLSSTVLTVSPSQENSGPCRETKNTFCLDEMN
jgi:hypothetical protein